MPDELTGPGAGALHAPPLADGFSGGSPNAVASGGPGAAQRRPSWLRAFLASLLVLVAGTTLGAAGVRIERASSIHPPAVTETSAGWRIGGGHVRGFSGLALNGPRLLWQNGPSIEYVDLESGKLRLLGPGPGMRATWAPAVGERYAIWFEAERTESLAAQAVAYDTQSGRRWTVADVGSVYSYPSLSGDTAVWCSATRIGEPRIGGVRIAAGTPLDVAAEYGTPVVSDGLVVWARGASGPFTARELSGGSPWPVVPGGLGGELTSFALAGRTLVWGQLASSGGPGTVAAASVDDGKTQVVVTGVAGLAGPAFDGVTVVWAEQAGDAATYRVMGRRLGGGPAFAIASVAAPVTEVAVSGGTAAWIAGGGAASWIETKELPR